MNLTLIVDQNHSYRQAVKSAYDKALLSGGVDEQTARECELVLREPEPDYVYHEGDVDNTPRVHEDGCISFRTLSSRDFYEHIKLNARRNAAECAARQMDSMWQDLKKEVVGVEPDRLKDVGFSVDGDGQIKPLSGALGLSAGAEKRIFEVLDTKSELQKVAKEYALLIAGLASCTIDGLSSKYARYFVDLIAQDSPR
jgi:hypothetical protein